MSELSPRDVTDIVWARSLASAHRTAASEDMSIELKRFLPQMPHTPCRSEVGVTVIAKLLE